MQRVYKITNKLNNKCYIGITNKSVNERFREHVLEAYRGSNRPICISIKKHGQENFCVECLAETETREEVFQLEKFFIEKYNTFYKGYNATFGGDGCEGESNPKAKRMNVYDEKGNVLYTNISSQRLEEIYGVDSRTISRWSLGKKYRNDKRCFYIKELNVFIVDVNKMQECDFSFKNMKSHNSNSYVLFFHQTGEVRYFEKTKDVLEVINVAQSTLHRIARGESLTFYIPKHNISVIKESIYEEMTDSEREERIFSMNLKKHNDIRNNCQPKGIEPKIKGKYLLYNHDKHSFEIVTDIKLLCESLEVGLSTLHQTARGKKKTFFIPKKNVSIISEKCFNNLTPLEKEEILSMNEEKYKTIIYKHRKTKTS